MIKLKLEICLILIFSFLTVNTAFAKIGNSGYRIINDPKGVYVIEINTSKIKNGLVPYCSHSLETNKEIFDKTGAKFSVNAGFFDPKNQKTVSYVIVDGYVVLNPKNNENLMNNKVLEPYMDKILNRSEFRIMSDSKGHYVYDIAPHFDKIPDGLTLKHSIQAGPLLFPELNLENEFFVLVKDGKIISESASALQKYARTAIGIRDNNVYIFVVTNQTPMTLEELADFTRKWGMQKSMAFDGGGSTSFDSKDFHIISEKDNQARKLKSFLILK
ncbi:MAG: phosphodiester glycosidase family protein [Candidatus Gastranaerophilales bacterium]|nr:phosphodiester glycosidase family protein [Candidatus Gastranaerophilales bacterium]